MSGQIIWGDGFDMYNGNGANGLAAWWTVNNSFTPIALTTGRYGGQALQVHTNNGSGDSPSIFANVPGALTSFAIGFAFVEVNNFLPQPQVLIRNGGTAIANLSIDANLGTITVIGPGGTIGVVSGLTLLIGTWHYYELEVVCNATTGSVKVYVDGGLVGSFLNVNTGALPFTSLGFITNGTNSGNGNFLIDDLYLANAASRVGELKVETIRPASDVTVSWTPSAAGSNFNKVNETLVDGDTTYVQTAGVGNADFYTVAPLSSTPGSVFAVNAVAFARKTDAGTRLLQWGVKSGSVTNYASSVGLSASYIRYNSFNVNDPNTGAPWAYSAVNSADATILLAA